MTFRSRFPVLLRLLNLVVFGAALLGTAPASGADARANPRVVVTTDINILAGDPDDRQSLVHLFYYLDELDVRAVIADRSGDPKARALEACQLAVDAYAADYASADCLLKEKGFPAPEAVRSRVYPGGDEGARVLIQEARRADDRPLYVLVWGSMTTLKRALLAAPDIAPSLRVFSIGTNIKDPGPNVKKPESNWNGGGRKDIFEDPRFREMWWVECDWINIGFTRGVVQKDRRAVGGAPVEFLNELSQYGALGRHLVDVTEGNDWARYFRCGDTPAVLYLLDPRNDPDDPTKGSWAGKYVKPFPNERPNYWTDVSGDIEWDYANPARTWHNAEAVRAYRIDVILSQRPAIYADFLRKVKALYRKG